MGPDPMTLEGGRLQTLPSLRVQLLGDVARAVTEAEGPQEQADGLCKDK